MTTYRADDFLEIYHTDSTVEAGRILEVVLIPQGIEGVIHDRTDHALPAPASQPGEVSIAVPRGQKAEAVRLLLEAREAGYLESGHIVE
jgi:hypothetical protein